MVNEESEREERKKMWKNSILIVELCCSWMRTILILNEPSIICCAVLCCANSCKTLYGMWQAIHIWWCEYYVFTFCMRVQYKQQNMNRTTSVLLKGPYLSLDFPRNNLFTSHLFRFESLVHKWHCNFNYSSNLNSVHELSSYLISVFR